MKQKQLFIVATIILLLVLWLNITIGAIDIPLSVLWKHDSTQQNSLRQILLTIRLPRSFAAMFVGAALALAGTTMQGLFRNPLVDPSIVGIMGGASLMVTFSIVLVPISVIKALPFDESYLYPISAFIGGLCSTLLLYRLSHYKGQLHIATMLLLGIALAAFTSAITGLLIYLANDQQLRSLTFWGMGSLAAFDWVKLTILIITFALTVLSLLNQARPLNAILLGEHIAGHLGFDIRHSKKILILFVALLTGVCVSFAGGIAFIGLVTPHIMRNIIGTDHRILLPASALCGSILLMLADLFARIIVSPAELPIGIITSLIGAPFLAWLVWRRVAQGS